MFRWWSKYIVAFYCLGTFASCGGLQKLTRADLTVRGSGQTKASTQQADARVSDVSPVTKPEAQQEDPPQPPPSNAGDRPQLRPASFQAKTGPMVGSVELNLDPGDASQWQRLLIRRAEGNTAPSCSQGTVARELNQVPKGAFNFLDQTDSAGVAVSYSACYLANDGSTVRLRDTPTAITKHQIMFTTSPALNGRLGGSAAAVDNYCKPYASRSPRAHLRSERNWTAVVSDSRINAKTRVRLMGPVVASDFSLIQPFHTLFEPADAFWSTGLNVSSGAILDATGNPTQSPVWTGSTQFGLSAAGLTCNDWSESLGNSFGQSGDSSTLIGQGWLNGGGPGSCNEQRALYCIAEPSPILTARSTTSPSGGIDLTVNPPEQAQVKGSLIIRRRAAAAGLSSLSCDSPFDTPIQTVSPITGPVTIVDTLTAPGTAYHYSVCLTDEFGSLVYSTRAIYIVAAAPSPP